MSILREREPRKKTWDKLWKQYNKDPYFRSNNKVIEIIENCFSGNLKGKKIIELGAGKGCDIITLAQKGAKGFALDFSRGSIKSIFYWAKRKNVSIHSKLSGIMSLPYADNFFDCVYSVGLMEHFTDPIPFIKEQIRVLKKGGFLIIDVPQKYTLYTVVKHIRMERGIHPFGWETEYSKRDLIIISQKLNQKFVSFYGRDFDVIQKIPELIRPYFYMFYRKLIENTVCAPYISLNIGLIIKVV